MKGSLFGFFLSCAFLATALTISSPLAEEAPVVKPAGKEQKLTLGGMLQVQGEFGDAGDSRYTKNDRVLLRRVRLGAQGGFLEGFEFRVEMELAGPGAGLRAQMTDGYVNYARKTVSLRIGQFKTPFGFEQLASDPTLFAIERSLANDRLTLGRQLGVQLSATDKGKRVSAAAGFFNGNGVNNGLNDNDRFLFVGRISAVPVQSKLAKKEVRWSLGADAYASRDTALSMGDLGFKGNLFSGKREGVGLDTQFRLDRFELWAEYLWGRFEPTGGVPAARFTSEGWYAQGFYYLVPKKLQAVLRYERFDPNTGLLGKATRSWILGGTYYIKDHDLKLQLNYQRSDAFGLSGKENRLFARMQLLF